MEARQAADNATRAVDDANAHLALLQEAQRAIASKYDTARRQEGGLVDRLDECVDALLLAADTAEERWAEIGRGLVVGGGEGGRASRQSIEVRTVQIPAHAMCCFVVSVRTRGDVRA